MSDEGTAPASAASEGTLAVASVALSVQTLKDDVSALRKQIRTLWIAVGVTIVLVIVVAGFSLAPRLLGVGFRGTNGQRFTPGNGQGFQPGSGNPQTPQQGTTPAQ